MHRGTVVVATLVLLAGCNAVPLGDSGGDQTWTDTVTPVPVTDSTTPEPTVSDDRPPGVAANGTVDADALVRAHTAQLENLTYTWVFRYDANDGDDEGSVRRVVVGNESFFVTQVPEGVGTNASMYVNVTGGFLKAAGPQGTRYELVRMPGRAEDYAFATGSIEQFLDAQTVSVSAVEREGRTYYRLYAVGGPAPATLGPAQATISDYTVTAYVTPGGFVRSLTAEYVRSVDGDSARITVRYDYSRLGESVPRQPDWLGEVPRPAADEPTDSDGTPVPNGTTVATTAKPTGTTAERPSTATAEPDDMTPTAEPDDATPTA